jgi:subtilase family serine protease
MLKASVVNYADAAAGPFIVQFVMANPGQDELILDTQPVDAGLAAGAATDLIVSITPGETGKLKVFARVDPIDQITETDESDNETALELDVVQNEINLTLPEDGLTVSSALDPAAPKAYLFTISMTNSGQSRLVGPMSVKYFGLTAAGDSVEWGTFDFEIDLAPGAPFNQLVAYSVEPGSYRAFALADSGSVWAETNEDDNEAFFDFTAP